MLALLAGAWRLSRRAGARKQVLLMLVLAAVLAINLAIWAAPNRDGRSLADAAAD